MASCRLDRTPHGEEGFTESQGSAAAGLELEPTISAVADRIAALLAEARLTDVRVRFAIGDQIHIIRRSVGERKANPIGQLAQRLGLDQSGLHRIARVAERIRGAERQSLLSLIETRQSPLCWSHLEELERVHGLDARLRLAREVAANDLPVRELRRRVRHEETVSKSSSAASPTMDNSALAG
jgi:hypothetical protein